MKKQIPNIITLGNLLCGVVATNLAVHGQLEYAVLWMFLGIFLDFFDGMSARLLKVASTLGKELDSLADVITSGVAPGFILFHILDSYTPLPKIKWIALLIPVFSAYRLAKFNLDTRQSHSFLGLPTPANALLWAALGVCFSRADLAQIALFPLPDLFSLTSSHIELPVLAGLSLLLDLALISEIPLFALKFKNMSWKDNSFRFIFLITSILLIIFFGILGLSAAIVWYILLSLILRKKLRSEEN